MSAARAVNVEIRNVAYGKRLFIVIFVIRRKYTTAFAALELYRFMLLFRTGLNDLYRHDSSSMLIGVPTVPTLPFESVASKISPGIGYLYLNMR